MKKGFTIIELLSVMIILSVIIVIAVPLVLNIIDNAKINIYKNSAASVAKAAKYYLAENINMYPKTIGGTLEVTVNDLIANGYIKSIQDPDNKGDTCNGYVIVTKIDDKTYDYSPNIKCGSDSAITDKTTDKLLAHYTFDDYQEATTNLIPNGIVNAYPTIGNSHATYNTNQYNSNTYFSIGTISSVTNNIVTLSTIGRTIYTYDVLTPQTTGGGVVAGTRYFIKKLSPTSFALYPYDGSQDGSKGFSVYTSITNDQKVSINSTSFPTMWHGPAHLPNSALVKEIIPNCFSSSGTKHECIRLHTEHKPEGDVDYMAYGVYPPVTAGKTYTFSFYYRGVNDASIGASIYLAMYTGAGWPSQSGKTVVVKNHDWTRYEITSVAPNTGGTNLYFYLTKGSTIDISEIQVEEKSYSTPFVIGTTSPTVKDYSGNSKSATLALATTPKYVRKARNGNGAYYFDGVDDIINLSGKGFDLPATFASGGGSTVSMWIKSSKNDNSFARYMAGFHYWQINANGKLQNMVSIGANYWLTGNATIPINEWTHVVLVLKNGAYVKYFVNGKLDASYSNTALQVAQYSTDSAVGAIYNGYFNGYIDDVRIYGRALDDDAIKYIYNIEK